MIKLLFGNQLDTIVSEKRSSGLSDIYPELAALYAAGIKQVSGRNLIWITGENENTDILKHDLEAWNAFLGDTETRVHLHCLPWEDPYINNSVLPEAAGEKNNLLADVKRNDADGTTKIAVITTLAALSIQLEKKKDRDRLSRTLRIDAPVQPGELIKTLSELGYHQKNKTREPGDCSYHGQILDIFPAGYDYPYRVTFKPSDSASQESRIQSIKRFHPVSQISIEPVASIDLTTTVYFETTKSKNTEILYLTELLNNPIIVASGFHSLKDEYTKLLDGFEKMRRQHGENNEWLPVSQIFTFPVQTLAPFNLAPPGDVGVETSNVPSIIPNNRIFLNFPRQKIAELADQGQKVTFCRSTTKQETLIKEKYGSLLPEIRTLYPDIPVSLRILYKNEPDRYFISFQGRTSGETSEGTGRLNRNVFDGIETGDYVVHQTHGIGRFAGIKHVEIDGHTTEYLSITYRDNANVLVPVHELDTLSKYAGFQGGEPALDKIGGASWEAKKKDARKNIVAFARELLDLYARRKALTGHSFKKHPGLENTFIKNFSFVETRGQKNAIKDVLTDLEAPFPMDRLVCGDVSFGKTEIALRAAVRVAANKKQVAVLCPTTVLAHQHYKTFKHRFADFPFRIELLSRNVPPPRRKEILQDLAVGDVDIIIGTHALLGAAVDFKEPGLFIVDEEQRFGVFQKEKLKKGREHIDVLSLSATPIPRTLSFTIAGLQDVSIIDTPPVGRKAIKNYIGPYCPELMMSAILKETGRGGQVFIIYNNIETIYAFKDRLQTMLPSVSYQVIHARMAAEEIEDTVFRFIENHADVLVSTTIIENGIDIPNVNTLVIMDAHHFGLTQLYQLRGRIGRGTRQAYTYLFHGDENEILQEKAGKRLQAIREFSQLGAGYKVAEFDLKMRGAGSLLGNKQHGHIEALGFDYYLGLLKNTIALLKGEETEIRESEVTVLFPYSISADYITESQERIAVYKRILDAATASDLVEIKEEIEDRYGEPGDSLVKGFFAQNARILARYFQFETLEVSLDTLEIKLRPVYEEKKEKLAEFIDLFDGKAVEPEGLIIEYPDYREFMETLQIFMLELEE